MHLPIRISHDGKIIETKALIDSGAGGTFMDQNFARKHRLPLEKLEEPLIVFNVDGTQNKKGTITHFTELDVNFGTRMRKTWFLISRLGKQQLIFGFPWLEQENPIINWKLGTLEWKRTPLKFKFCGKSASQPEVIEQTLSDEQLEEEDNKSLLISFISDPEILPEILINAKATTATSIAQQEKKIIVPLEELVPKEYHAYLHLFDKKSSEQFPEPWSWDHKIKMKADFEPKVFKKYNLSPIEQKELDKFIDENLEKGYIVPSQSPMASPFFFISKKDGSFRPCQDYWYLNEKTVKNVYPLPNILELMDQLRGARYFSKFDIRLGYNNVGIRKGDEWKVAFITNQGLFEPTVMFFSMCNSPATFQAMMDDILGDMKKKGYCIMYMDDIMIYADTLEKLHEATLELFNIIDKNDLFFKAEKCVFAQTKVPFLGMIIEHNKVSMDPAKVQGIADWPEPTNVKELRAFLGFGNFYQKFITRFAKLAHDLYILLQKGVPFIWAKLQRCAFLNLKTRFTEEPVLMIPDPMRPFQIESDMSKHATGALLTQMDRNGDRHPCTFISKTFSPAKWNYEIYDRELLALIRTLPEWCHYIHGSPHTTTALSDHKNLTYWRSP